MKNQPEPTCVTRRPTQVEAALILDGAYDQWLDRNDGEGLNAITWILTGDMSMVWCETHQVGHCEITEQGKARNGDFN
jgi:hypothetical protein